MKGTFRLSMCWLHTWGGLLISWLLFAVLWSGTLSVFEPEISHWMQPERQQAHLAVNSVSDTESALRYLEKEAATASTWRIQLPDARSPVLSVAWPGTRPREWIERVVDVPTESTIDVRKTEGAGLFRRLHISLHAGTIGVWLVALAGLMMLVSVVSGIIVHKRIFTDLFTFRPRASSQRSWLDGHTAIAVVLLPFHIMIAYTGLVTHFNHYMPAAVDARFNGNPGALRAQGQQSLNLPAAGQAASRVALAPLFEKAETILGSHAITGVVIRHPGDANATIQFQRTTKDRLVRSPEQATFKLATGELLGSRNALAPATQGFRTMAGLHFGQFGGWILQWLYFLAGLASCALVATGLVLFAIKRRRKYEAAASPSAALFQVAERLNITAVGGLIAASAAYLCANRLLAIDLQGRATDEMMVFWVVWLASAMHSFLRPVLAAWREQLTIAGLMCLALPVLDVMYAGDALQAALQRGDLVPVAVDTTAMALGLALALLASRLKRSPAMQPLMAGA